MSDRYFLVW